MRQKALVLGALPPFVGPWVQIGEAEKWNVTLGAPLDGNVIDIDVWRDGQVHSTSLPTSDHIQGVRARARLESGKSRVSVILESE